jgi:hypothetical protein
MASFADRITAAMAAGEISSARRLARPRVLRLAFTETAKPDCCDETGEPDAERAAFVADIVDEATGGTYRARGVSTTLVDADVVEASGDVFVSIEEIEAATRIVTVDERFARRVASGALAVVPAMPGAVTGRGSDGSDRRLVTMAVRDATDVGDAAYQLVDVDLVSGAVAGVHHLVPISDCGSPDDGEHGDRSSTGQVMLTVSQGGIELWSMTVVRPGASTMFGGIGLSVRAVNHRGRRVLYRGDTPIVNVRYDHANVWGATSYRDWLSQEAAFRANGVDVIPGYRVCAAPVETIFDADAQGHTRAGGNFNGVSFHFEGSWLVLTSVMAAGWYRYRAQWRFHPDGRIVPSFGFAAVKNAATCDPHAHHCYWRLDFDIETAGNNRVEQRHLRFLPAEPDAFTLADFVHRPYWGERFAIDWSTVPTERRMGRGLFSAWRVTNRASGRGYVVYPGINDGHADTGFGVGDVWALRYRASEDHDPRPGAGDAAHIDDFVNGEAIDGADVVLWYAGHGYHDQHADDQHGVHGHVVGPVLAPHQW